MKKINIGCTADLLDLPIIYGLEFAPALQQQTVLHKLQPGTVCNRLLDGTLAAGIISPSDYARYSRDLLLTPSLAIASRGACALALLFFRENLDNLENVAVFGEATIYRELASLVLNEFFEADTEWRQFDAAPPLEQALLKHAACFFEGTTALENAYKSDRYLDIVEEWCDKTDLPFLHRVVAMPRNAPSAAAQELLQKSFDIGWRNLENIAKSVARPPIDWTFYFDLLNNNLYFQPVGDEWEALRFYFQYLFYHGKLDDIPEIHLFEQ